MNFIKQHQPLIDKKYKFIYQPICKVGCKTIKTWMLSLKEEDLTFEMGEEEFGKRTEFMHNRGDFNIHELCIMLYGITGYHETIHKNYDGIYISAENIKKLDKENFEIVDELKSYFKFTFTRNPWSRIVSAYLEKFRNPN